MWSVLSQINVANPSLFFPDDFSPFLLGLVGVMWFVTGLLVWMTLQHSLERPPKSREDASGGEASFPADDVREAA
jgi:hypothetical protein